MDPSLVFASLFVLALVVISALVRKLNRLLEENEMLTMLLSKSESEIKTMEEVKSLIATVSSRPA